MSEQGQVVVICYLLVTCRFGLTEVDDRRVIVIEEQRIKALLQRNRARHRSTSSGDEAVSHDKFKASTEGNHRIRTALAWEASYSILSGLEPISL
jgi:hypothetical protein